ncbi:hypothetical protein FJV83_29485 [Mesorhizobium sp. WSM4307]|nr:MULTISPECIES: hypothetical protein [unclassified Mesorhizobium]TRC77998.1 hypothetical protein FJV81_10415 [Mesorhizobium sp. WSM4315]TRC78604.1 hypothetical protein FJV83_29485 [Mesorhizobium sp. WSM4307]TRC80231.1 hypothetical protein FJV80_23005 [Mesorhizobium sp. WSM4310]
MAEVNHRDFPNRRSYVPSCADKGSLVSPGASEPVDFSLAPEDWMFNEKENRFIEAGLLLAVPISVAITSLIAVFAL